jgi:hypothetical protein
MTPSASHDELLARRHAQRAPRGSSLETKLTSSFLPADRAPNDASSSDSSSVPTSAPTTASHDEFLARRHAERAPRACSIETKPSSSFLPVDRAQNDASSSDSSSVPTSAPPSASHDEFLARRHAQRAPRVSSLEAKLTSSFLSADRASDRQVDDDCECVLRAPDGRLLARFLLQLAICSSKREPRVAPALHDNLSLFYKLSASRAQMLLA